MKGNPRQKPWCQVLHVRLGIVGFHLYRAVRATVRVISVFQADMARRRSLRRQRKGMLANLQTTTEREVTLPTLIWPQTLAMDRSDQLWSKEKLLRTGKVGWPVTQFYDDLYIIYSFNFHGALFEVLWCRDRLVTVCIAKLGRDTINNVNCILLDRVGA